MDSKAMHEIVTKVQNTWHTFGTGWPIKLAKSFITMEKQWNNLTINTILLLFTQLINCLKPN